MVCAWADGSYHILNTSGMWPNLGPGGRPQHQYRKTPPCKVLLIAQILVSCDKYVVACLFCRRQQIAILEGRPSLFIHGVYIMPYQLTTQRLRCSLVE